MSTKTELYRSILMNMGVDLDTLPDNLTSTFLRFIAENCADQPEDGFSPIVEMRQIENGADITITDKYGTKTVTIANGKDGKDATITSGSIAAALNYTPANAKDVTDLKQQVQNQYSKQQINEMLGTYVDDVAELLGGTD